MILWLYLSILGCTEEKVEGDNPDELEEVEGVLYEYYDATSLVVLENSGMSFEETYIVRRELDTNNSQIDELFYSTIDGTLVTVTLDVDAEAKSFALSFSDDSYTGEGSFEGAGLVWTSWESQAYHTDGTFVLSEDSQDEAGIHTRKVGYGMNGNKEWEMIEELTPLSKDDWAQLFSELPSE